MTRTYVRSNWHSVLEGAKKAYRIIPWCAYCGRYGTPERDPDGVWWHVDHVHAIDSGGQHVDNNLAHACHDCNSHKSNQWWGYGRWHVSVDLARHIGQMTTDAQPIVVDAVRRTLETFPPDRTGRRCIDLWDVAAAGHLDWGIAVEDTDWPPQNWLWRDARLGWCVLRDTLL